MRPNGRAKRKWVATDRKINNALSFGIFFELVSKFHNFFFSIYLFLKNNNVKSSEYLNNKVFQKFKSSPILKL